MCSQTSVPKFHKKNNNKTKTDLTDCMLVGKLFILKHT